MILHSLIINYSKDIRPAVFTVGGAWNIRYKRTLDKIIRSLARRTTMDKRGRVLCLGKARAGFYTRIVKTPADEQDRIFIVKMGHDGILWTRYYPLYEDVINTMRATIQH